MIELLDGRLSFRNDSRDLGLEHKVTIGNRLGNKGLVTEGLTRLSAAVSPQIGFPGAGDEAA